MITISPPHKPLESSRRLPSRWLPRGFWSGLSFGSCLGVLAVVLMLGVWDQTSGWLVLDLVIWSTAGLLYLALFNGIISLLHLLLRGVTRLFRLHRLELAVRRFQPALVAYPLAALCLVFATAIFDGFPISSTTTGGLIVISFMLGGTLYGLSLRRWHRVFRALVAGLLVPAMALVWLLWPGPATVTSQATRWTPDVASALQHPGQPGSYALRNLTYGSGVDQHRLEYASEAALLTEPVDGSALWNGFVGPVGAVWEWYWGFDVTSLPLNGRVWYPEGPGPFPLVLIVHGNHAANQFSDAGYAYLAEHLASKGFVAVSTDQNFLNGTLLGDAMGFEMTLRAWLLTEHLTLWKSWNTDPASPFYSLIDMDRVALIGHSRGGEAALLAAGMVHEYCSSMENDLDPDLSTIKVAAVVAIAPSDTMARHCGSPVVLHDVDYLTINGGLDADVGTFYGIAAYNRTRVDQPNTFKAAVYLHRANHGQFNSDWGYGDLGVYDWLFLDRASLLTETEQQLAAKSVITGFLEASVNDVEGYLALFRQPDTVSGWMPDDLSVTRYADGSRTVLEGREAIKGVERHETQFNDVRRIQLSLRADHYPQNSSALLLSWDADATPELWYQLEPSHSIDASATVSVDLGSATDTYLPAAVSVALTSANGATATVPLDGITAIRPPLETPMFKWPGLARILGEEFEWDWSTERLLQTYEIPLALFVAASPDLDLSSITEVRVVFDGSLAGSVLIDQIAFETP